MPFQGRNFIPQGRNGHTSFEADRQAGGRPEPSLFDGFMRDIAEGLASVLRLDGSVAMRAPFNGGGFRFTNAADATDEADLVTRRQLTEAGRVLPLTPAQVAQNGAAISLSPPIAWTSYAAGQQAEFFVEENVEATNVTIQVSGLGRVGLFFNDGIPTRVANMTAGQYARIVTDGDRFLLAGSSTSVPLRAISRTEYDALVRDETIDENTIYFVRRPS